MRHRVSGAGASGPRIRRVTPEILFWLGLVVLWITWGTAAASRPPVRLELVRAEPLEAGLNLLLLAPLGLALGAMDIFAERRRLLGLLGAIGLAPLLIEWGQTWLPGRSPTLTDWALNSVGGTAAALVGWSLSRRGIEPGRLIAVAACATGLAVIAVVAGSAARLPAAVELADWDARFHVASGEEVGGLRRYSGTVSDASICAGRESDGTCVGPGAGDEARATLAERAMAKQVLHMTAEVVSSGPQVGPARIVTFSGSTGVRNASLLQAGSDLVLRVRSRMQGPNGAVRPYQLTDVVPAGVPTRVSARYDRGAVELRSEWRDGSRSTVFRWSVLNAWLGWIEDAPLTGASMERASLLGAAVLFLPVGIVVNMWRARRPLAAVLVSASLAILLIMTANVSFRLSWIPQDLILSGALGALAGLSPASRRSRRVSR